MGGEEHGLWLELGREWMRWRDEMILRGTTDPELVRELLLERESAWERQPRANLGGRSARSVVEEERARQGEMELPFG